LKEGGDYLSDEDLDGKEGIKHGRQFGVKRVENRTVDFMKLARTGEERRKSTLHDTL